MDELLELLNKAETLAKEVIVFNESIPAKFQSPHAVPLRARISAAIDSLKAHENHVAANPLPLPPAPEVKLPATAPVNEQAAAPAPEPEVAETATAEETETTSKV